MISLEILMKKNFNEELINVNKMLINVNIWFTVICISFLRLPWQSTTDLVAYTTEIYFLTILESESKIKVSASLDSSKAFLFGLWWLLPLYHHMVFLCFCLVLIHFYNVPVHTGLRPTHMSSFYLVPSLKIQSPNIVMFCSTGG